MNRTLSLLFEAQEPNFHHVLARLEAAGSHVSHDIRLVEHVNSLCRDKISALGLDPHDTTGEELYRALQVKLAGDDQLLIKRLRAMSAQHINAEANVTDGLIYALEQASVEKFGYGIKNAVLKRILTKIPPKRTMRSIGYRSIASMLKHEPLALLTSVAINYESETWLKQYRQQVKALKPKDCETRAVAVYGLNRNHWRKLSLELAPIIKQTVIVERELSTLVILDVPSNNPKAGLATATLGLGLSGLNEIHSSANYLKISQVSPNFGERMSECVIEEPKLSIGLLDTPLSWETVQRFVHKLKGALELDKEDHLDVWELIGWQPIEKMLVRIAPELKFWQDSGHLAQLDKTRPVSLNILDNSLNLFNHRDYDQRVYRSAQRNLWQELVIRYIRPDLLVQAINNELQPKLALELTVNA